MDIDRQKNFYDDKRYFQGKDDPGEAHPDPRKLGAVPLGQIAFGLLFIGLIAAMAVLRVRQEDPGPIGGPPPTASAPAAAPAAPTAQH